MTRNKDAEIARLKNRIAALEEQNTNLHVACECYREAIANILSCAMTPRQARSLRLESL